MFPDSMEKEVMAVDTTITNDLYHFGVTVTKSIEMPEEDDAIVWKDFTLTLEYKNGTVNDRFVL